MDPLAKIINEENIPKHGLAQKVISRESEIYRWLDSGSDIIGVTHSGRGILRVTTARYPAHSFPDWDEYSFLY